MATPTATQNLQAAYASACAQLAEMEMNPQPNYSEQGRSVSWQAHHDAVLARVEKYAKLIGVAPEQNPVFEVNSVAR